MATRLVLVGIGHCVNSTDLQVGIHQQEDTGLRRCAFVRLCSPSDGAAHCTQQELSLCGVGVIRRAWERRDVSCGEPVAQPGGKLVEPHPAAQHDGEQLGAARLCHDELIDTVGGLRIPVCGRGVNRNSLLFFNVHQRTVNSARAAESQ